jgi:hypothetical protein
MEWLRTTPRQDILQQLSRERDYTRGTTFVVRSFLYVAYADVARLVFTPDVSREPVVESVVEAERDLRERLLQALDTSWQRFPRIGDSDLKRNISLLAAVVFERAKPDRTRIVPVMKELREQLAPLRQRLRRAEDVILNGQGDDPINAEVAWNQAIKELQRSFGAEPHLVSTEKILSFGEHVGDLADEPQSPKAWMAMLLGLPFEIVKRLVYRRPAVELHRLRRDRPAVERLRQTALSLFGSMEEV